MTPILSLIGGIGGYSSPNVTTQSTSMSGFILKLGLTSCLKRENNLI